MSVLVDIFSNEMRLYLWRWLSGTISSIQSVESLTKSERKNRQKLITSSDRFKVHAGEWKTNRKENARLLQHASHTDLHSSNIPRNTSEYKTRHYLFNVHVSIEYCDKFYDSCQEYTSRVYGKRLLTHPKIQLWVSNVMIPCFIRHTR